MAAMTSENGDSEREVSGTPVTLTEQRLEAVKLPPHGFGASLLAERQPFWSQGVEAVKLPPHDFGTHILTEYEFHMMVLTKTIIVASLLVK